MGVEEAEEDEHKGVEEGHHGVVAVSRRQQLSGRYSVWSEHRSVAKDVFLRAVFSNWISADVALSLLVSKHTGESERAERALESELSIGTLRLT